MSGSCTEIMDSILWGGNRISCARPESHLGKHQAFKANFGSHPVNYMNICWNDEDGATTYLTCPLLWNECDDCGILILDKTEKCDDCLLEERIHEIVTKHYSEMIIVDGMISIELEKVPKNRNAEYTVIWHDETKPPLTSSYLQNVTGPMPKRYRDALPDNARIQNKEVA